MHFSKTDWDRLYLYDFKQERNESRFFCSRIFLKAGIKNIRRIETELAFVLRGRCYALCSQHKQCLQEGYQLPKADFVPGMIYSPVS